MRNAAFALMFVPVLWVYPIRHETTLYRTCLFKRNIWCTVPFISQWKSFGLFYNSCVYQSLSCMASPLWCRVLITSHGLGMDMDNKSIRSGNYINTKQNMKSIHNSGKLLRMPKLLNILYPLWYLQFFCTVFGCTIACWYTAVDIERITNGRKLNFGQTMKSQNRPHTSPARPSYEASFLSSLEKRYRKISIQKFFDDSCDLWAHIQQDGFICKETTAQLLHCKRSWAIWN